MDLQRCAGNGGTLVGRQCGVAHQEMDFANRHVQLFGDQLGQGGTQARAQVNMAMQSGDTGVIPQSQQAFVAFTGKTGHKARLPCHRRGLRQRGTQHQQNTSGAKEVASLFDPKCSHQVDLFAAFCDIKAAA